VFCWIKSGDLVNYLEILLIGVCVFEMEMSIKFDIEKYDGKSSFALWQVRMAAMLSTIDVKDANLGRGQLANAVTDKKWRDMDGKAFFSIQLCSSNSTLQKVLSEKIAKSLWEKLENIFMKKSLTNRLRLKLRLYTLCMEESTSISNHITKFTSILNDLDMLGVKVEDEDQALLLLCSLPASYKTFRDMMVYSREKITLEDVKSTFQAKLYLYNEMTNIEKGSQGVGLVVDRGRS
jgi:gag-polypeptide of LTR copia-type